MKKILLFIFCFTITSVYSQELRINSYGSYMLNDKMSIDDTKGTLYGSFFYGGGLEYVLGSTLGAEFSYQRIASDFQLKYQIDNYKYPYTLNYFMLGLNHYLPVGSIEPYYGVEFGLASLNIKKNDMDPYLKFAWGAKLGLNLSLTPTTSIRFQAGLKSMIESFSADLYFDSHGIHPSVNTNSHIYQFSFGGGLIFKIPYSTFRKSKY